MIGGVATDESGAPTLHIHLVLGKQNGAAVAGHLDHTHVRPTLEVLISCALASGEGPRDRIGPDQATAVMRNQKKRRLGTTNDRIVTVFGETESTEQRIEPR